MELLEHLNTALDESLLSEPEYHCFREKFNNTKKLLSGYIRYLQTLTDKDRKFQNP